MSSERLCNHARNDTPDGTTVRDYVHPTDLADLGVPDSSLKPHSVADKKRILDFDRRQYVQADPQLRQDLELMWRMGGKAEIEQISEERERGFLVNNYLAGKIAELEHLG